MIPWFNIVFFAVLIALVLFIRAMWRQFRERTIDPALEDTRDAWEKVDDFADEKRGRVSRWWRSWRGRNGSQQPARRGTPAGALSSCRPNIPGGYVQARAGDWTPRRARRARPPRRAGDRPRPGKNPCARSTPCAFNEATPGQPGTDRKDAP